MSKTKKRAFMDGYPIYDPGAEGYGNPKQWRNKFRATMGFEEAEEVLRAMPGDSSPLSILGLSGRPTWNEIKAAYRRMARKYHPDVNPSPDATEQMKKINAAFAVLERQYQK
jgi:DnaJ-class molecular chaperone